MKQTLRLAVNLIPSRARHWIKHLPLIARLQRFVVNRVLSGEPFVHRINAGPANGLQFEVTLPHDKQFWTGMFEAEFAKSLSERVRRDDVCYDVGGHRGYMAGVLGLAGASRVIVFEPLPDNVVSLKRLIELNPQLPLQIEQMAVGNSDGEARFKVMADRSMGKLATSTFQAGVDAMEELTVPLRRLDSMVFDEGLAAPNLIKIDVEGAEFDVLCGSSRTLAKYRPRLFIEAHTSTLADLCVRKLIDLGYEVRQLERGTMNPDQTRHLVGEPK